MKTSADDSSSHSDVSSAKTEIPYREIFCVDNSCYNSYYPFRDSGTAEKIETDQAAGHSRTGGLPMAHRDRRKAQGRDRDGFSGKGSYGIAVQRFADIAGCRARGNVRP